MNNSQFGTDGNIRWWINDGGDNLLIAAQQEDSTMWCKRYAYRYGLGDNDKKHVDEILKDVIRLAKGEATPQELNNRV